MSCCGNRRHQSNFAPPRGYMVNESPPPPAQDGRVIGFEYTGRTSMTVLGPSTWRRYNFECSGAIVNVDARDAEEMVAVPHLRPVFADTAKPL